MTTALDLTTVHKGEHNYRNKKTKRQKDKKTKRQKDQ